MVDRARAWDGRAAAVRHDAETVLLSQTHLGLAVPRLRVAAETVLRVTHAVPRHLGEVPVREPRLEHHGARVDLHAVRMKMLEALRRGNRQRLRRGGIVRPAGRMHPFTRRHHRGDPAVHVRVEKIHCLLSGRVVPQHHMTVRIDQPRNHRRPQTIHHHIRPAAPMREAAQSQRSARPRPKSPQPQAEAPPRSPVATSPMFTKPKRRHKSLLRIHVDAVTGGRGGGRVRSGSKGPVPSSGSGRRRPDGAQTSGAAHTCRVVLSTPTAPGCQPRPPAAKRTQSISTR